MKYDKQALISDFRWKIDEDRVLLLLCTRPRRVQGRQRAVLNSSPNLLEQLKLGRDYQWEVSYRPVELEWAHDLDDKLSIDGVSDIEESFPPTYGDDGVHLLIESYLHEGVLGNASDIPESPYPKALMSLTAPCDDE